VSSHKLTTTSHLILGLLALRRWSTYELAQQMKRSLRHFWPRAEDARYDEARQHLAPDFVNHTPAGEETCDDFLARIKSVRDAFPDWANGRDEMLSDGDFVITRWTGSGTHRGTFRDIAPTGREITVTGIAIDRVTDGRRAEGWALLDTLGLLLLLLQLGATVQATAG